MIVQQMRVQRGWSQQDLADLSGLNVRTIQRLESGQTISIESFKALGAAFNIDFTQLQQDAVREITATAEQADLALALNRVRQRQRLYQRLFRFVVIGSVLLVLSREFMPSQMWIVATLAFWGLLIGLDALRIFEVLPWLTPDWERREIEKLLGRKL